MAFPSFINLGPGRAPCAAVLDGNLHVITQDLLPKAGYGLFLNHLRENALVRTQSEPIFSPGAGEWDGLSIVTARISSLEGGGFLMLYGGSADSVDEPAYFGLARSADLRTWERHPGNPVFGAGARGAEDGGCIWYPALLELDDRYILLYEGSVGTPRWGLDCTVCRADLIL